MIPSRLLTHLVTALITKLPVLLERTLMTMTHTHDPIDWPELLAKLAEPFPPSVIQWRAGSTNRDKSKAQALPYAEPRVYEDRLNEVCPGHWEVTFQPWGESRIICHLSIHGVTRSSTGEEGSSPADIAGTAAEAQAFKRACSKFKLGKYLYDLPVVWVPYDGQSKKLLQVPKLPVPPNPAVTLPSPAQQERLSKERASVMHRELALLGIGSSEHYAFATRIIGRSIRSLTELTGEEAKRVWNAAKRQASDPAHPTIKAKHLNA